MTEFPRRMSFVDGQMLTAEDFRMEQDYHRSMRYRQNRLHGQGVVHGLEVTVAAAGEIHLSPGLAIDAQGREVVLAETRCLSVDHSVEKAQDVMVAWAEVPGRTVPASDGSALVTMVIERPEAMVTASGQGPPDAVLLARVVTKEGEAEVDRSIWHRHPLSDEPEDPCD